MTPRKPKQDERRRNVGLPEHRDELIEHVRKVAAHAREMPQGDLEYAQDRLEWLADEIWQKVMENRNAE